MVLNFYVFPIYLNVCISVWQPFISLLTFFSCRPINSIVHFSLFPDSVLAGTNLPANGFVLTVFYTILRSISAALSFMQ